jgi:hypothetical protein
MVIRKTEEVFNGFPVYLIGATADSLSKFYKNGDDMVEMPLDDATIAVKANISYTKKDGTVSRTQQGATSVLGVVGKFAITRNKYTTPSGKAAKEVIAVWDTTAKNSWYPEYFRDPADMIDLAKALQTLL